MMMKSLSFVFATTLIFFVVLGGCSGQDDGSENGKTAADNEKVVTDFLEAYNLADTDKIISFFADDSVYEDVALGRVFRGKKEISDFHYTEDKKLAWWGFPGEFINWRSHGGIYMEY